MATADAFFSKLNTFSVSPSDTPDGILKRVESSVDSINKWIHTTLTRLLPIDESLGAIIKHQHTVVKKFKDYNEKLKLQQQYIDVESEELQKHKTIFSKSWIETQNILLSITNKIKQLSKNSIVASLTKTIKTISAPITASIALVISGIKTLYQTLKYTGVNDITQIEKIEKEMNKKYGKNGLRDTIGATLVWLSSARHDIDRVFDWIQSKGIAVFKWFVSIAMDPLQAMWEATKTLATIGWELIKGVFTVFSTPINMMMNFLGKAIQTILFNPIIFIPLVIALSIVSFKLVKIFTPFIIDIVKKMWSFIKPFFKKHMPKLVSLFNTMWTTVKEWLSIAINYVFSDKNKEWLSTTFKEIFGVSFEDITNTFTKYYSIVKEFMKLGLWELINKAFLYTVRKSWENILEVLGLSSLLSSPTSSPIGIVDEHEKSMNSYSTQIDDIDSTYNVELAENDKIQKELANVDSQIESNMELSITNEVKNQTKTFDDMYNANSTELESAGNVALRELSHGIDKVPQKEIENIPEIKTNVKKIEPAKRDLQDAKKSVDNPATNTYTTARAVDTMIQQEIVSKEQKQLSYLAKQTPTGVSTISKQAPSLDIGPIHMPDLSSIGSNNIPFYPTFTVSTDFDNIGIQMAQMDTIGMGSKELVSNIGEMAPHYTTMYELFQLNTNIKTLKESNGSQNTIDMLQKRIAELNSKLQSYTLAGHNKKYDALTPDMISFENGRYVIQNNWNSDPIFRKIIDSSHTDSGFIPGAARGGLVTDTTLAVVGEGSVAEIIIPLTTEGITFITEAITKIILDKDNNIATIPDTYDKKSHVKRFISSINPSVDKTIYDMKLLSSAIIGVS